MFLIMEIFNLCNKNSSQGYFFTFYFQLFWQVTASKQLNYRNYILFLAHSKIFCSNLFYCTLLSFSMIFVKIFLKSCCKYLNSNQKDFLILNFDFYRCGTSFCVSEEVLWCFAEYTWIFILSFVFLVIGSYVTIQLFLHFSIRMENSSIFNISGQLQSILQRSPFLGDIQ